MAKRKVVKIDENKCDGCSLCIPNCPEGAIKIIDGKARLISDLFCDGLGACLGHCPKGAITIEEREAEEYDETKVMENVIKQGNNVIKEHLLHLRSHGETVYFDEAIAFLKKRKISLPDGMENGFKMCSKEYNHSGGGCPGSKVIDLGKPQVRSGPREKGMSCLGQWPIQVKLVPVNAPYFKGADLLIAADCVPFAYADFHEDLLKGKILLVGCPKLDDIDLYKDKITQIFKSNDIRSVVYAHMEVPCCFGFISLIEDAIRESGKDIPFENVTITIKGEKRGG